MPRPQEVDVAHPVADFQHQLPGPTGLVQTSASGTPEGYPRAPHEASIDEAVRALYEIADWAEAIGDGDMAELALVSIVKLRRMSRRGGAIA